MAMLGRFFIRGLMTLVPMLVTVYILYLLVAAVEASLGELLQWVLTERYYITGMGFLAGVAIVTMAGFLVSAASVRLWFRSGERLLVRLPLVSLVYGATRDLMTFIQRVRQGQFNQVVMVELPGTELHLMGFVTREDFSDVPAGLGGAGQVAVYLPMSYQIGGYTVVMPRAALRPLDMSVTDAMRYAVTAGVSAQRQEAPAPDATRPTAARSTE
jgi:uncharacterized membrane protein